MTKKKDPKFIRTLGRPTEYTPSKLDTLGKELLQYMSREDVFHISHFEVIEKDHEPGWLNKIADRHPDFQSTLKKAKHILGNKLLTHAMLKGGDRWVINTLTPLYVPSIKDHMKNDKGEERESELKARMRLEEYRSSLNRTNFNELERAIDKFDNSQEAQAEVLRLRAFIEEKGLKEELAGDKG